MKKVSEKLFLIAGIISKKTKNIIPQSFRWRIKNRFLKKSIDDCSKRRQRSPVFGNYPRGINLIGSIRAEMGLGQSCRLVADMILKCNYPLSIYNARIYNSDVSNNLTDGDTSFDSFISESLPYGINIFHVNPLDLGKVLMQMPEAWEGRYNIAFWLWELEEFPKEWISYCKLFDEIWVPSEFVAGSIRKVTDVPVHVIPYYVSVPKGKVLNRKDFRLPDGQFLFLLMFDTNSTLGRKNPMGALEAFKLAFPPDDSKIGMVLKINNADEKSLSLLRNELSGYKNIYFLTEKMEKERINSLIECVDVFVSLHRAEGFGLVMAEAMLSGTPVIATNWSSNVEFMDESSACMVNYTLIKNLRREDLYRKGCIWAEPDYRQAADYMKKLAGDKAYYELMQEKGKAYVMEKLGAGNTIDVLKQELDRVWHIASGACDMQGYKYE